MSSSFKSQFIVWLDPAEKRLRRNYQLLLLTFGLLCVVQASLNIALRLTCEYDLYPPPVYFKNMKQDGWNTPSVLFTSWGQTSRTLKWRLALEHNLSEHQNPREGHRSARGKDTVRQIERTIWCSDQTERRAPQLDRSLWQWEQETDYTGQR